MARDCSLPQAERYAKAWTIRYAQIVKNCSSSELIPILPKYSELDSSTIYSDCRKAYDGLVDYTALAYYKVRHSISYATLCYLTRR